MDMAQASQLIERHVAQAEAILVLRDILSVSRDIERKTKDADAALRRKLELVTEAESKREAAEREEADAKRRASKLVQEAIDKAAIVARDSKAKLESDLCRIRADILKATSERSAIAAEIAALTEEVTIKRKRKNNGV